MYNICLYTFPDVLWFSVFGWLSLASSSSFWTIPLVSHRISIGNGSQNTAISTKLHELQELLFCVHGDIYNEERIISQVTGGRQSPMFYEEVLYSNKNTCLCYFVQDLFPSPFSPNWFSGLTTTSRNHYFLFSHKNHPMKKFKRFLHTFVKVFCFVQNKNIFLLITWGSGTSLLQIKKVSETTKNRNILKAFSKAFCVFSIIYASQNPLHGLGMSILSCYVFYRELVMYF